MCCKRIPEIGVAIRIPESKMAAKMAAKIFNFESRWIRESPNTTILWIIKGCKTIREVGFSILSPESKTAAKTAAAKIYKIIIFTKQRRLT